MSAMSILHILKMQSEGGWKLIKEERLVICNSLGFVADLSFLPHFNYLKYFSFLRILYRRLPCNLLHLLMQSESTNLVYFSDSAQSPLHSLQSDPVLRLLMLTGNGFSSLILILNVL